MAAFELLRNLSQQSNVKLIDIAEKLIALQDAPRNEKPSSAYRRRH
jgi:hypothetical protein